MTGLERIRRTLNGESVDRSPMLPIVHTGLASVMGVKLGDFLTDADVMADVTVSGCKRFGFDGVNMSMGVTGEAEALGAKVDQPEDGSPILREYLLDDMSGLDDLRSIDPTTGGRMPLFYSAVKKTAEQLNGQAFVLPYLRGPFLAASQLRGVEQILMDLIDSPEQAEKVLNFTTEVALRLGKWLLTSGANGLILGEATCSPNFISPNFYRETVLPKHRNLVNDLKKAGWQYIGFHICGNTIPIIEDAISTEADFMDIDYQVSAKQALSIANGRITLRGNLDPSSIFRFGKPEEVKNATKALMEQAAGYRWILSSGCDIPPGTPAENIEAFAGAIRG